MRFPPPEAPLTSSVSVVRRSSKGTRVTGIVLFVLPVAGGLIVNQSGLVGGSSQAFRLLQPLPFLGRGGIRRRINVPRKSGSSA